MPDLTDLPDRIREEAGRLLEPGHRERLEAIAADVERLQRGAKTLGHIIESNGRAILDITGRHDLIGDDGDGDWGAVWEHLYELPAKAWDEGSLAMRKARMVQGESLPQNPYRTERTTEDA